MRKLINWIGDSWIGKKVAYIVENYLLALIILAIFGIISAIIGHYGKMGFNWKWFVFFELPLYLFLSWASWKLYKLMKKYDRKRI